MINIYNYYSAFIVFRLGVGFTDLARHAFFHRIVDGGASWRAPTAIVWVRRARQTGERKARKQGPPRRSKLDPHREYLLRRIEAPRDNQGEGSHPDRRAIMKAVTLHRIDAAQNMHRFYRIDIERDLFGGVLLTKTWGRIGARGRVMAVHYDGEAHALDALQKQAARKRRRGYAAFIPSAEPAPSRRPIFDKVVEMGVFA